MMRIYRWALSVMVRGKMSSAKESAFRHLPTCPYALVGETINAFEMLNGIALSPCCDPQVQNGQAKHSILETSKALSRNEPGTMGPSHTQAMVVRAREA